MVGGGPSLVDYDGDGRLDLLLTGGGTISNAVPIEIAGLPPALYRNLGDWKFVPVTADAGLAGPTSYSHGIMAADYDNDGFTDLFVSGYGKARLLHNDGAGSFCDVSRESGLRDEDRALGFVAADMNNDGWTDIYVANDEAANRLYLGGPSFPLREIGELSGAALSEDGAAEGRMGVDWGDFDGDGRGDLFVTNFELEDNALYRQEQPELFRHVSIPMGLGGPCRSLVGFGTGFVDFDLDGWLDLFICNGHVFYRTGRSPCRQPAFVFRNREGRHFDDVSRAAGDYFRRVHVGRGAAPGDLDNNGTQDLVIVHQNDPVSILKNRQQRAGWISLRLIGRNSSRDPIGTVVTYEFEGRKMVIGTIDPRRRSGCRPARTRPTAGRASAVGRGSPERGLCSADGRPRGRSAGRDRRSPGPQAEFSAGAAAAAARHAAGRRGTIGRGRR